MGSTNSLLKRGRKEEDKEEKEGEEHEEDKNKTLRLGGRLEGWKSEEIGDRHGGA